MNMSLNEHQHETYKSMVTISVEAMKFSALANGGAAVALLAYLGNVISKGPENLVPDMSTAMFWFLAGLMCSGLLIAAAYLTQLSLYNESFKPPSQTKRRPHLIYLRFAILMFLGSLSCFVGGSLNAVDAWTKKPINQSQAAEAAQPRTPPTSKSPPER